MLGDQGRCLILGAGSHSQTVGVGRSAEVNRTMSYQFPRETTSLIKFIYPTEYDQLESGGLYHKYTIH